jgi:hypothetical protein
MADKMEHPAGTKHYRRVWPLFFFLILAIVSLLLHMEKSHRQKSAATTRARFAARVRAAPIEEIKAHRARFYEIQYYAGYPTSISYAVADLIRHLDNIVRTVRLLGVQIDLGLHDLTFRLTVGVAAAGPEAARRKFAVFFEELRAFPEIIQASFSVHGRAGAGDGLHVFAIRGRAEWQ